MNTLAALGTLFFKWIEWNAILMGIAWVLMHLIVSPLHSKKFQD